MKNAKLRLIILVIGVMMLVVSADADTLTILHVNDSHSHILPYGPHDAAGNRIFGGVSRLAAMVGMQRITQPNVMLFHSGDFFVGDFMFQEYIGIAELEIMKAIGFDALELGNHEFDLYPQTLAFALSQAGFPQNGFPVLCANLDLSGYPDLGYFVRPYIIRDFGTTRVGIFGLLTDLTNLISNPSPVAVLPPVPCAAAWVDSLRNGHNCDIVILLSHLGFFADQQLAATVPGIDVIIGGHSHTEVAQPIQIGGTLIVQAKEFYRYLGKLQLVTANHAIQSWSYELLSIDASVPSVPVLDSMVANLVAGVEYDPRFGPVYSQTIAQAAHDITQPLGNGICRDNGLGNLAAEAMRQAAGTDIAIQPQGFCSQTIYQGAVTGADVFQAIPYGFDQASGLGFKMATFETDGMSIIAGLEFSVYYMPYMEDFLLHCANISYAYDLSHDPGNRVDYLSVLISGRHINPMGTYSVAAPEGVVPFLSQIPGFQINNLSITNQFIYNIMRDYIVAHSPVVSYRDGRVMDLSLLEPPINGIMAVADVVSLFGENGFINRSWVVNRLCDQLQVARRHLERNRIIPALMSLATFRIQVRTFKALGYINPTPADRLIFLAGRLMMNILPGFPKEGEQEDFLAGLIPIDYELMQNYPNPFNPQTEIAYSLPEDGKVRLVVYDIVGREVAVLADDYQPAGIHSVVWDGRNKSGEMVASGVYFYRLEAGDFSDTKKMSLVR